MGGWTSTKTQNTILTPELVKAVINNIFLGGYPNTFMGYIRANSPNEFFIPRFAGLLGSTAYLMQDEPDVIYGDIDALMVVPELIQYEDEDQERQYVNRCINEGRKFIDKMASECPFTESVNKRKCHYH